MASRSQTVNFWPRKRSFWRRAAPPGPDWDPRRDSTWRAYIVRVDVKQGDTVKAGQILIILEAMKMQNEIVAPKDGTVAQVVVKTGDKVDTGAALVVLA